MLDENYKQTAAEFLTAAKDYCKKDFTEEEDLFIIIEAAYRRGDLAILSGIAFSAKSIEGLKRVIRRAPKTPEVENIDHVKKELTEEFQKLKMELRELLSEEPVETANHFEKKYFLMDPQSFENLQKLCGDLEELKLFINSMKRDTP